MSIYKITNFCKDKNEWNKKIVKKFNLDSFYVGENGLELPPYPDFDDKPTMKRVFVNVCFISCESEISYKLYKDYSFSIDRAKDISPEQFEMLKKINKFLLEEEKDD